MTLDDREKPGGRDRLGPGETLLLEAADGRFAYHRASADKVGNKLLAQAREKVPEPEIGPKPCQILALCADLQCRSAANVRFGTAFRRLRGHPQSLAPWLQAISALPRDLVTRL